MIQTILLYENNVHHDDMNNTKLTNLLYLVELFLISHTHTFLPGNEHNEQVNKGFLQIIQTGTVTL